MQKGIGGERYSGGWVGIRNTELRLMKRKMKRERERGEKEREIERVYKNIIEEPERRDKRGWIVLSMGVRVRVYESEREKDRQTDRMTDIEIDTEYQTDRMTNRETDT